MNASNSKVLKDIESFKYKDCYLVYNRRSEDEPDSQKNSLSYQTKENLRVVKVEKLKLADVTLEGFCTEGIINESHSAFKEDRFLKISKEGKVSYQIERPKFGKLGYFLHQGFFKGVIFLCWDRAARNKSDNQAIRHLMAKQIDLKFAFTKYDDSSSGELHKDIDSAFAEHHSRVTSEKVKTNTRNLRSKGVCTFRAPVGYLNTGDMYNKPFDPKRKDLVTEIQDKFDKEDWSLHGLAAWANEQGLTMPPVRRKRTRVEMLADDIVEIEKACRPLDYNCVHRILTNPFYAGYIKTSEGELVPSVSHEPMVSWEKFERIQKNLRAKGLVKITINVCRYRTGS